MRAREIILEAGPDWEAIIRRDCKPFMDSIDNNPVYNTLYRGLMNAEGGVGSKRVRLDGRTPMTTNEDDHNDLNKYFNEKYGHPYRNGLFCSGNKYQADDYGDIYVIFPIGEFDFIYNEEISDLYIAAIDRLQSYSNWVRAATKSGFLLQQLQIKDKENGTNLAGQFKTDTLQDDTDLIWDLVHEFRESIPLYKILDYFEPYKTDGNMMKAIKTEHEIMMWVESYYYVRPDLVNKWF